MTDLIRRIVFPWFFRVVRRHPVLFAAAAMAGEAVGLTSISIATPKERAVFFIGVGCLLFYTGLLVMFVVKLRRGTWAAFCEWAEDLSQKDAYTAFNQVNIEFKERVRTSPCPRCGQPAGDRPRPGRTSRQRIWGGWTCPNCGLDRDFKGNARA